MSKDDSARVRKRLEDMGCDEVNGVCGAGVQYWFPFDERVPPSGDLCDALVYFDNITQQATTLSGGGATVEEGVLVVDLIASKTQLACGSMTLGRAYGSATQVAQRFTVASTTRLASVAVGSATQWLGQRVGDNPACFLFTADERSSGTLPAVTPYETESKITISQQPIVGPAFRMKDGEVHIPVQIGYRAVTNGPD